MNFNFNIPPVISSSQETVMILKESSDSSDSSDYSDYSDSEGMTEEKYEAKVKELSEQCRQFDETAKECHGKIKECHDKIKEIYDTFACIDRLTNEINEENGPFIKKHGDTIKSLLGEGGSK